MVWVRGTVKDPKAAVYTAGHIVGDDPSSSEHKRVALESALEGGPVSVRESEIHPRNSPGDLRPDNCEAKEQESALEPD